MKIQRERIIDGIVYKTNKSNRPTVDGFVTLNTGYSFNADDIPSELLDAALQLLKYGFTVKSKLIQLLLPLSCIRGD